MSVLLHDETRLRLVAGAPYRIQFFHDSDASPPWDDCRAVPLLSYPEGSYSDQSAKGYDLLNPLPFLTDRKITANRETLAEMAGYKSAAAMDSDARAYYPDSPIADGRREILQDWLREVETTRRHFEKMAELWKLAGVPAEVIESRGYCQGDWSALLIVAHPEAVKSWGFKTMRDYRKTCPDDLKSAAKLWGAWCWGGVVGYEVSALDPDEWESEGRPEDASDLNRLDGDHVDSCWGFYPEHEQDYFPLERNHAYALAQAIEEAEYHGKQAAAKRAESVAAEIIAARPDLAPT
jgi:hypothetical protein